MSTFSTSPGSGRHYAVRLASGWLTYPGSTDVVTFASVAAADYVARTSGLAPGSYRVQQAD